MKTNVSQSQIDVNLRTDSLNQLDTLWTHNTHQSSLTLNTNKFIFKLCQLINCSQKVSVYCWRFLVAGLCHWFLLLKAGRKFNMIWLMAFWPACSLLPLKVWLRESVCAELPVTAHLTIDNLYKRSGTLCLQRSNPGKHIITLYTIGKYNHFCHSLKRKDTVLSLICQFKISKLCEIITNC